MLWTWHILWQFTGVFLISLLLLLHYCSERHMAAYGSSRSHRARQPRPAEKMLWTSAWSLVLQAGSSSPSNTVPPDPLSWRTEPPEQNSPRSLQAWTVPLVHTGDNQAPQSGTWAYLILNGNNSAASPWRRRSHRNTDLERVLFRNVLNSYFPLCFL